MSSHENPTDVFRPCCKIDPGSRLPFSHKSKWKQIWKDKHGCR
jgi:hypothetical protein